MGQGESSFIHMQRLYHTQTNTTFLTGSLKIIFSLNVHPVTGAVTKKTSKSSSSIGADGTFSEDDLIDSARWHLDRAGKLILAEIIGSQVLI